MAMAQTAQMLVELNLAGNFTSGIGAAESRLAGFGTAAATGGARTGLLASAFGQVEGAASKFGGALSHAKSQIGGLLSGPLGIIGLTGGLLSFGGAIKSTLDRMNDLAFGTEKLVAITGGNAKSLSTLIAATEKYGISVDRLSVIAGFYEKTVGKLEQSYTKSGLSKLVVLQKQYHVVLTDGKGKALPFEQALLNIANAYQKQGDKGKAAALAATLFGRSWQVLAPILAQGKAGILELEAEAAKMGLQLNQKNVADFAAYRAALRGSQEAIAGLEVAIGEDLLPTIIDLANGVKAFVTDHKTDIVAFFHNAVDAGKHLAGIIGGVVSTLGSAWNSIPAPLRDFLTKGLVADRTIKFLFGFSPVEGLLKGAFGQLLSRGSTPLNPLWVQQVGGGLGGLPVGGGGATGILGTILKALPWLAVGAIIADGFIQGNKDHPEAYGTGRAPGSPAPPRFTYGPRSALVDPSNYRYQGTNVGPTWQDLDKAFALRDKAMLQSIALDPRIRGHVPDLGHIGLIGSPGDPFGFKHLKAFAFGQVPRGMGLAGEIREDVRETNLAISRALRSGDSKTVTKLQETKAGLERLLHDIKTGTYHAGERAYRGALAAAAIIVAHAKDTARANLLRRAPHVGGLSFTGIPTAALANAHLSTSQDLDRLNVALASKAQATTNKVGDLDRTTASGSSSIVSAIRSSRPITNIHVSVTGTSVRVQKTYSQGDMGGSGYDLGPGK